MVVAAALARAEVAAARGEPEAVLHAMEPVLAIEPRAGVDEPGFWPWPDVYAEALISVGRLDEAEELLAPHEELAAARGRAAMTARLAGCAGGWRRRAGTCRTRRRPTERALERVGGAADAVRAGAGGAGLRAGAAPRRPTPGRGHAAAGRPGSVRGRCGPPRSWSAASGSCAAAGSRPAKRSDFDPGKLTAQEQAVARLVAVGMSNRQVAAELFVSIKTVQFHLTHIYAKLGIGSRAELAAQFRE